MMPMSFSAGSNEVKIARQTASVENLATNQRCCIELSGFFLKGTRSVQLEFLVNSISSTFELP